MKRARHGDPGLEEVLVRPGNRDIEQIGNQQRLEHAVGRQVHREPSGQTKPVGHQDALGQMGQHDRDVERHLVVAEAGVVPGHEEPAHESPLRAVKRRLLHGDAVPSEIDGGNRCG